MIEPQDIKADNEVLTSDANIQTAKKDNEFTHLSKFVSLILRHKPEIADVTLDERGWTDISSLLKGIKRKMPVTKDDILLMAANNSKNRFEISSDKKKIRARYGHSIPINVQEDEAVPPEILFHGTGLQFVESIQKSGINAGERQYVHLSETREIAKSVGSRHGKPAIFIVAAGEMHKNGFHFYHVGDNNWITEFVPKEYLKFYYK